MSELWHWVERIGGGLLGLAILGVLIVYVPALLRALGRVFWRGCVALWRAVWRLPATLAAFRRNPWAALQRWSDQSTLLTLLIYPPLCLLERIWPSATKRAPRADGADGAQSAALDLTALSCLADRRGRLAAQPLSGRTVVFRSRRRSPGLRPGGSTRSGDRRRLEGPDGDCAGQSIRRKCPRCANLIEAAPRSAA